MFINRWSGRFSSSLFQAFKIWNAAQSQNSWEKNKEEEVERGGNLPLLGSTHAVFLFTSFCVVHRNWTPGTGLHGSVDLGNDYLTNRFHMLQCAVRLFSNSRWLQNVAKTKMRHWAALSRMRVCHWCFNQILTSSMILVNRPRVTWNLYSLHNEQRRSNDILASYRFTVRGFVLDFQVVQELVSVYCFFFLIYKQLLVSHF